MPLYKYALLLLVVTALLVKSSESTEYRFTQYRGKSKAMNRGNTKQCSKKCFGNDDAISFNIRNKAFEFKWPVNGEVTAKVEEVKAQPKGHEWTCSYSTGNSGKTMHLYMWNANGNNVKFEVKETDQHGHSALYTFDDVKTASSRRRRLLRSDGSSC